MQQHKAVSALMTSPEGTYNDTLAVPVQQHGPLQDITNSLQHLKMGKDHMSSW